MTRTFFSTLLTLLLFCPGVAFSDQAAVVYDRAALRALQLFAAPVLREYCAPCHDRGWTEMMVHTAHTRSAGRGQSEVIVNGKPIDLAYVYIQHKGQWSNVALLLDINVSDVPKVLPAGLPQLTHPDQPLSPLQRAMSILHGGSAANLNPPQPIEPIDQWFTRAMSSASTTYDTETVYAEGYKRWDRALNRQYQRLMHRLAPPDRAALRAAEHAWLKYRKAERGVMNRLVVSDGGTLEATMGDSWRMNMVRERAIDLENYNAYLDDGR